MDQRLILVTLLVKLGAATAVASALVRSRDFQRLLFREERALAQKIYLALFIGIPIALGVVVRLTVRNFLAADFSLEGAIVMGVVGGRVTGVVGGALVALPAVIAGQFLALPVMVLAGFTGGLLRVIAPYKDEIWSFSPFIDLSIYRWIRKSLRRPALYWQPLFFLVIVVIEALRIEAGLLLPRQIFHLYYPTWPVQLAIYAATVATVAIPLKIWNNARIQRKLEEQERLLLQARMEALQSQINPHFLFNTLNTVSSLVRFDPDSARELILKLANILRRLMRKQDAFVRLSEEVSFIDDFLDIEVVRFGRDKLRVEKQLDPATLDMLVPSMVLQPLVENSTKHGLAPKVDGGCILLRSTVDRGMLVIEVEDDGVGLSPSHPTGIGLANVSERLQVLYGEAARIAVTAREGGGTRVTLRLPVLQPVEVAPQAAPAVYEASSSTER